MNIPNLTSPALLCACIAFGTPAFASDSAAASPTTAASADNSKPMEIKPAEICLKDLQAFDGQMEKDGYWLGGSGYGYGYPMGGFGFGYPMSANPAPAEGNYLNARPGHEVRILIDAANVLARRGQQQACEDVLSTTKDVYKTYLANFHSRGIPLVDIPGWRKQAIASAKPVSGSNISFRSDELLGTEVRNSKNDALGSVDDLVVSPQTGKIAYLVVARDGIFGIGEKYVPVPWEDFKSTSAVNLLVLETTAETLEAAPRVKYENFAVPAQFEQESQKVDAYWKTHLTMKVVN